MLYLFTNLQKNINPEAARFNGWQQC